MLMSPDRWKLEQVVDVCWYRSEDVRKNVRDVITVRSRKKGKKWKKKKKKWRRRRNLGVFSGSVCVLHCYMSPLNTPKLSNLSFIALLFLLPLYFPDCFHLLLVHLYLFFFCPYFTLSGLKYLNIYLKKFVQTSREARVWIISTSPSVKMKTSREPHFFIQYLNIYKVLMILWLFHCWL